MPDFDIDRPKTLLGLFYFVLIISILIIVGYYILLPGYYNASATNILDRSIKNTLKISDLNMTVQFLDGKIETDFVKEDNDVRLITKLPVLDDYLKIDTIFFGKDDEKNLSQDLYLGFIQKDENILDNFKFENDLNLLDQSPKTKDLLRKILIDREYININPDDFSGEDIINEEEFIDSTNIMSVADAIYASLKFISIDNVDYRTILNYGLDKEILKKELAGSNNNIVVSNLLKTLENTELNLDRNILIFVIDNDKNKIENITLNFPTLYTEQLFKETIISNFVERNLSGNQLSKLLEIDLININNNLKIEKPERTILFSTINDIYKQEIVPVFGKLISRIAEEYNVVNLLNNENK